MPFTVFKLNPAGTAWVDITATLTGFPGFKRARMSKALLETLDLFEEAPAGEHQLCGKRLTSTDANTATGKLFGDSIRGIVVENGYTLYVRDRAPQIAAPAPVAAVVPTISQDLLVGCVTPSAASRTADAAGRLNLLLMVMKTRSFDVLLAPEYYWNYYSSGREIRPFSFATMQLLTATLCGISVAAKNRLLIPGTFIWTGQDGQLRNSALVFLNGETVGSVDGRPRYDKAGISYERGKWRMLNWQGGEVPLFEFFFKGLRARLEICLDHGTRSAQEPRPDVQFVVSASMGSLPGADTVPGGWCFQAEPGFSSRIDRNTRTYTQINGSLSHHNETLVVPRRD